MLSLLNAHPRDDSIQFEEAAHIYTVNGVRYPGSATGVIKKWFEPFDAKKTISDMRRRGTFAIKHGTKSTEEVEKEWSLVGATASARGTRLHKYIEDFYNGCVPETPNGLDTEVDYFHDFWEVQRRKSVSYVPYRTEWYVFDHEAKIAGSIDMVYQVAPRTVAIYDWKCSKEIRYVGFGNLMAKGPCAHMPDCNFSQYTLQLNLYKYILETYYDLVVNELALVILHETNDGPQVIHVPDRQDEIKKIIQLRKDKLNDN